MRVLHERKNLSCNYAAEKKKTGVKRGDIVCTRGIEPLEISLRLRFRFHKIYFYDSPPVQVFRRLILPVLFRLKVKIL